MPLTTPDGVLAPWTTLSSDAMSDIKSERALRAQICIDFIFSCDTADHLKTVFNEFGRFLTLNVLHHLKWTGKATITRRSCAPMCSH